MMHFRGLNLNLLVSLDALLTEKSVSRAAEKLHITQPAMSASLQRLRQYLSDPLLHQVGRKFELTPRALAMSMSVKELRSEEHTSELQSLMRISYAVLCLKKN